MIDLHSTVDMFAPVFGENLYDPEIYDGGTFRWTGPGMRTTIRLPALGGGDLQFRWILAMHPAEETLSAMSLTLDGRPCQLAWALRGNLAMFSARTSVPIGRALVEAELVTPTFAPPNDPRTLGVAISRIEVSRLRPDADDASIASLRRELADCSAEVAALRASTSWKITAPLRWLKSRGNLGS